MKKIQITDFGKKSYEKPRSEVYHVTPAKILAGSEEKADTEQLQEEEYEWE